MDLVLEAFDTLVFDKVYATLFPLPNAVRALIEGSNASYEALSTVSKNMSMPYLPSEPYETTLFPTSAYAYQSTIPRNNIIRESVSLFLLTVIFGFVLYFSFASLSYLLVFDKQTFNHPKYLKNQMYLEIKQAVSAMPFMALLTVPWFIAEIKGYSFMYWDVSKYGVWYMFLQVPLFIAFTDCGIYMIHRGLHHPIFYKHLHKPHHKWIVPTPYASHAFHPVDGYLQSIPYHLFPFVFPLHKALYIVLFVFINIWTILIHDGEYMTDHPAVNGAACHTMHHLYFNYNYGQFFTLWDRVGGSYRKPDSALFDKTIKMSKGTWTKQSKEMEKIAKQVESVDDRVYVSQEEEKKQK
ncbi:hypothetical protein V1511DRAFT_2050 [Dipodascopsis uninucleata]